MQKSGAKTKQKVGIDDQLSPVDPALQKAYRAMARAEARYHDLFDHGPDMYHVLATDGTFKEANDKHTALIGYTPEELEGMKLSDVISEASWPKVQDAWGLVVKDGKLENYEIELRKKDGSLLPVSASIVRIDHPDGEIAEIRCSWRDLSEHKLLEEQLRQSQKMETLGTLAGGVAHDFNNLLTAISGYLQMAMMVDAVPSQVREYLEQINMASERASALTQQLLAFSRRQIINPKVISLNDVVAKSEQMLRRLVSENIELVSFVAPDLGSVNINPNQIEQVLMNLVVNARDAMPESGKLTIETANVTVSGEDLVREPDIPVGDYVMLSVSDTGTGISEDVKARLFEPFFTTKEEGKGTGLGLSTCFGIVKQNNGHILVHSQLDHGTTFEILIPRVNEPADQQNSYEESNCLPTGSETILVVEDDAQVRGLAVLVLRRHGYTVLGAGDGIDAFRTVQEHAGAIHLVLTDVVMPNTNVVELTDRLKVTHPHVKTLFTSGYTDHTIVHSGVLDSGVEFLAKPYKPVDLLVRVRQILNSQ